MKQGLRWVLWSIGGLLLAAALLWGASRMWGVRADERAALAQMRTAWLPPGRNAFDAFWTFKNDVPPERWREVVEADIRAIRGMRLGTGNAEFRSAAAAWPDLSPDDADRGKLCTASNPGCLAMVSADIPGYAALVARNAKLIARADALSGFDHYKFLASARADAPLPAFAGTYIPATRDALLFAQGSHQEALANVCRGISTWRRYAARNDMLVTSMVAVGYAADGYGGLFAEMLAALPAGTKVPAQCHAALAEVRPAELSLCQAMKGEFAIQDNTLRALQDAPAGTSPRDSRFARRLVLDVETTSAMNARGMAEACGDEIAGMVARDIPAKLRSERHWGHRFACIANSVGCILSDIAAPAYADYILRRQDFGMKLRLLGTLLWLHENPRPDTPLAERLAQRPASLKSPAREIEVDDGGGHLVIRLYGKAKGAAWMLPLPRG